MICYQLWLCGLSRADTKRLYCYSMTFDIEAWIFPRTAVNFQYQCCHSDNVLRNHSALLLVSHRQYYWRLLLPLLYIRMTHGKTDVDYPRHFRYVSSSYSLWQIALVLDSLLASALTTKPFLSSLSRWSRLRIPRPLMEVMWPPILGRNA